MANEHDQLLDAAFALDDNLAGRLSNTGLAKSDGAQSLPEDLTAAPDDRDIAASRDGSASTSGESR